MDIQGPGGTAGRLPGRDAVGRSGCQALGSSGRSGRASWRCLGGYQVPGAARPLFLQGKKFMGDLQPDGRIVWQETGQVFNSPSAWATHCKKLVNPAKKSGCGWASVKYKGQKLDKYKAAWLRRHQLHVPTAAADEVRSSASRIAVGQGVPSVRTLELGPCGMSRSLSGQGEGRSLQGERMAQQSHGGRRHHD